jgi:APA family basic amino acid/polyamine antiporter
MACWIAGGIYALMGAVAVAELAAMIPETGGFRVYARRAFGEGIGFAVGWVDWLCGVVGLAYVAVAAVTFLGALWPAALAHPQTIAVSLIAAFTAIHWAGLRLGSSLTAIICSAIGLLLMSLVIACFLATPVSDSAPPPLAETAASFPAMSVAMLFAFVVALRAILTAYDGWYAPIYMAEENTNAVQTLPRAIIGGTLLVVALYLLINLALLRVLPLPLLAASPLPAADAARLVFPRGAAEVVTVLSLLTMLSLLNNTMLTAPRILFAIGRDGLLTGSTAVVSAGGTPRVALLATSMIVAALVLTGTFEQLIGLFAVLFLLLYIAAFAAVFVLRRKHPELPRPYRAFAYPVSTALVLLGSVAMLIAAVAEDPRSGVIAAMFLAACAPVYAWSMRAKTRNSA